MGVRRIRWGTIVLSVWVAANSINEVGVAAAQSTSQTIWTDQDVGGPSIAGSASSTASGPTAGFTITAGGSNIGGSSDQFHFVYQQVSGDVDVLARVDSLAWASAGSKAGVMIRGSLDPGAANAFALVSAGRGTAFQRRTLAGGLTTRTAGSPATAPLWVRLWRQGSTIAAYTSDDGMTWTLIDSDTVPLPAVAYVGLAVTSHDVGIATTASFSQIGLQSLALPAGQLDADVGGPDIAGAADYESGTYSITAGGADIGGTADQFNYVYQPASGDLDVSVRIDSITAADPWSQAGVMIRETLDPGSRHAFALVSAGNGFAFQRRAVAGGTTVSSSGSADGAPAWLRLTRTGSLFTAYQSFDGSTWTLIDSDTITMAGSVYVGIAAASHNAGVATDVVADSLTLTQNTVYQPPVVSITSPADGSTFTAPATITITANASDPQNQLTEVDFYNGTTLLGAATTAPYTVNWTSVPAGTDSLTAVAYDAAGLSTQSAPVSVTILDQTLTPPTGVEFLASSDNATVTYYQLDVFNAGDDPTTATPVASLNGGMPTPDANDNMMIMAPDFFGALPSGNYQLTISAVSPAGVGRSVPMAFSQ